MACCMRSCGFGVLCVSMVVTAGLALADPLKDAAKQAADKATNKAVDKAKELAAAPADDMAKAMEEMAKAGTPGAEHKNLEAFVGEWEGTLRFWMGPGTEAMEQQTSCASKMEFGGRYLYTHWSGDMGGEPFRGVAITGFNNLTKEYQSTWIDNQSTAISSMTGKYDAGKKSFEWVGEEIDPVTKKKMKLREVQTITPDTFTMEFYKIPAGGKEEKSMEITMKRKAAQGK